MAIFRCKTCGGQLEITEGETVCKCEYCGNTQTLPKTRDTNIANLFNRANDLRLNGDFDRAQDIYEKIVVSDPSEADAYWGIVLCKFGVEYVDDPASGSKIPTCHRADRESIRADINYKSALKYADLQQYSIYESEAERIDNIQRNIFSIVDKEKPYDVFICYKETDENGNRTEDSILAEEMYHKLTEEGYKVFYSAITLRDKFGEYEPYIFAALTSAKVMLVFGTKSEYFRAIWVRNEWSRYLKLMQKDRNKLLIPCYKNMNANSIPDELSKFQAQDISSMSFLTNILAGIRNAVKQSSPAVNTPPVTQPRERNIQSEQPRQKPSEPFYQEKERKYSSSKKNKGCIGSTLKIAAVIILIWIVWANSVSKNAKRKETTEMLPESEIVTTELTEPAPVFGEEVIELHDVTPTELHLITESASYGYVLNNVLWDGAFVYRAGNGDNYAYAIYQTDGLFEKLSLRATPLLGHQNFFKSSTVDVMIINDETNEVIYSQTLDYYSEDVKIEADITGVNSLKIYVNKTSSGLGDLGYTLIKDAYLYPVGYSEENTQDAAE